MPDPLTITAAITVASRAFAGVKKMVELGREAEDTFGQIGKWMEASHDVNKAKERAEKPSLFKKITGNGSIQKQALDALIAQKQLYEQRKQLRSMIMMAYGKESWDERLSMERKIRTERTKVIHAPIKFRQKIIDIAFIIGASIFGLGLITGFIWIINQGR